VVEGNETLEIEARRRAVEGYNERVVKDSKGNVLSVLKDYSDGLLTLLLKVRDPARYSPPPQQPQVNVLQISTTTEVADRMRRLGLPMPVIEGDYEDEPS
jgi:hypothetical protein